MMMIIHVLNKQVEKSIVAYLHILNNVDPLNPNRSTTLAYQK